MLELILFLIAAALLGSLGGFLLRDTPVRRVRLRDGTPEFDATQPRLRRAFEVLCKTTLEGGNRVEFLENGDELFPRLLEDLRSAEHLITFQVFWFKPGQLADQIAEVLIDRAKNGVEVLLLLDYFGSHGVKDEYKAALRTAGVQVSTYRPPKLKELYKFPHRSHVRSVVIDSRVGYTGGFGIDDRWRGDGRAAGHWRDTHVRIDGPIVDQLQAPFIANWAECSGDLLLGAMALEAKDVAAGGSHRAGVMYASPSLGSTSAERFLAVTIASARSSLFITSAYFVPSRGFRSLLCQAAERGVDVRVLTPGGNTDEKSAWYAGRAHYEELIRGGVRIYEYSPTMIHAKTIVADDAWVSVGSVNFDNRSLKLNDEVAFVAQDTSLGAALRTIFLRDLDYAREVELASFAQRSAAARFRERAALLVAPFL